MNPLQGAPLPDGDPGRIEPWPVTLCITIGLLVLNVYALNVTPFVTIAQWAGGLTFIIGSAYVMARLWWRQF
jgi:hypothetical protein